MTRVSCSHSRVLVCEVAVDDLVARQTPLASPDLCVTSAGSNLQAGGRQVILVPLSTSTAECVVRARGSQCFAVFVESTGCGSRHIYLPSHSLTSVENDSECEARAEMLKPSKALLPCRG